MVARLLPTLKLHSFTVCFFAQVCRTEELGHFVGGARSLVVRVRLRVRTPMCAYPHMCVPLCVRTPMCASIHSLACHRPDTVVLIRRRTCTGRINKRKTPFLLKLRPVCSYMRFRAGVVVHDLGMSADQHRGELLRDRRATCGGAGVVQLPPASDVGVQRSGDLLQRGRPRPCSLVSVLEKETERQREGGRGNSRGGGRDGQTKMEIEGERGRERAVV